MSSILIGKEDLLALLKENLTLQVDHKDESEYSSGEIRVTILFDGETVCEGWSYVFNS